MAETDGIRSCAACARPVQQGVGRGRPRRFCIECRPPAPKIDRPSQKRTEHKPCAQCGAVFHAHLLVRYCTEACRLVARQAMQMEKDRRRRPDVPRQCRNPQCAATFTPAYGSRRRAYCTRECRRAVHNQGTAGNCHKRRARERGLPFEDIDKVKVFERDGWRCQLCGCHTPQHLQGKRHPQAPQLDHIVPMARRGGHTWSNVQCACMRCNLRKGARPAEQPGLPLAA